MALAACGADLTDERDERRSSDSGPAVIYVSDLKSKPEPTLYSRLASGVTISWFKIDPGNSPASTACPVQFFELDQRCVTVDPPAASKRGVPLREETFSPPIADFTGLLCDTPTCAAYDEDTIYVWVSKSLQEGRLARARIGLVAIGDEKPGFLVWPEQTASSIKVYLSDFYSPAERSALITAIADSIRR